MGLEESSAAIIFLILRGRGVSFVTLNFLLFSLCMERLMFSALILLFALYREFAARIPRPFSVRYNPYTQSVEVLDSKDQILKLANDIRADVSTLQDALNKFD